MLHSWLIHCHLTTCTFQQHYWTAPQRHMPSDLAEFSELFMRIHTDSVPCHMYASAVHTSNSGLNIGLAKQDCEQWGNVGCLRKCRIRTLHPLTACSLHVPTHVTSQWCCRSCEYVELLTVAATFDSSTSPKASICAAGGPA